MAGASHEGIVMSCATACDPEPCKALTARSTPLRLFSFLDHQGCDSDLYFTDAADDSLKAVVAKTYDFGTKPALSAKTKETT